MPHRRCLRTSVGGGNSTLKGKIVNIKATDSTTINENIFGNNSFGSGDVDFTGISGENNLVLDPTSQFSVETKTIATGTADTTDTRVSSAGSSATIDTSTNAEIKSTEFISSFQQAFDEK